MASESRARVLVVDDTPENLDIIKGILADRYRLSMARDGATALRIVEQFRPDLILLDIMMPEMDGHEVYRRLRAREQTRNIPVIFITALAGEQNEVEGLALGAADYITKPITPSILRARISTQLTLLSTKRELNTRNEQLQREREIIEDIVLRMRNEAAFDGTHLRIASRSPEAASGDVVLAAFTPGGIQHVLLGDFTGHGLPAAVGAPLIGHIFYDHTRRGIPLAEILETLNRVLLEHFPTHIFMAASAAAVDRRQHRIDCYNYGQPGILLIAPNGTSLIASSRPALGILPFGDEPPSPSAPAFTEGAHLYLRTDGFHEAPGPGGEAFGESRLRALIDEAAAGRIPPQAIVDAVLEHAGAPDRLDDMTLVEITL